VKIFSIKRLNKTTLRKIKQVQIEESCRDSSIFTCFIFLKVFKLGLFYEK
jgi:hypothetical protein